MKTEEDDEFDRIDREQAMGWRKRQITQMQTKKEIPMIEAMKQVIKEAVYHRGGYWIVPEKEFESLRQAIAEAEKQEPVAWVHRFIEGGISFGKKPADLDRHPDRWQPLYTDPTPCKTCETLAMSVMADHVYHEQVCPKREWVGLTDEEIDDLAEFHGLDFMSYAPFTRAIEDKLKEKNT